MANSSAAGRRRPGRYLLLTLVALLGAVDVGQLIVSSPKLMAGSPSRAGGSALGLLLFLLLAVLTPAAARGRSVPRALTRGLAALLAAGSLLLVVVHAAAGVGGLRPASVALLALLALLLAW